MVPSLARQRQDYDLVAARLYGPGGALERVCARLASDCAKWRALPGDFAAGLTPERLPERVAALFPVAQLSGAGYSLMPLRQDSELPPSLRTELEREPGVSYVDEVAGLTATLALLRGEVSLLLGCFVALFAIGSLLLLRRRGLLLLSCVLVPMVVSLTLSAGGGVSLFHVLALLLVLGLAVDTAVFYLELGLDGDSWLASTLATMTSILAFGLLSLSRVPVLHYFGTVVFAGLLCSWLVTPLLFRLWGHPSPVTRQDADCD
jgi:predicted exporter